MNTEHKTTRYDIVFDFQMLRCKVIDYKLSLTDPGEAKLMDAFYNDLYTLACSYKMEH